MIPDVILGAGPSGLMVATRLKQLGRPFVVLERGDKPMAKTGGGFFYLHQPMFGTEREFKIKVTSCPGADEAVYAKKVYGDATVRPVSIKKESGEHIGYQLDQGKLYDGVSEGVVLKVEVAYVDVQRQAVFSKDGRSWPYRKLHSTIPLPIFSKMMPKPVSVRFHSKPIYIETMPRDRVSVPLLPSNQEMRCHYCPGSCHDWYRVTCSGPTAQFERVESTAYAAHPIFPGKIWYDPLDRAEEEEKLNQYRFYLDAQGVLVWGRYGEWRPKRLLHEVWNNLKDLR